jgi:Ca-activated chloride channel family protein
MGFMDKMRQWRVRPLALVLCLCTGTGLVAQTFRATIDTVQVNVTVTDAAGRLVTGLSKDDFEILEDGAPQTITVFTDERVPISLGVLLDSSDSMRGQRIADARAAVEQFVSMLIDAGDEAFIAAFNHRPRLIGPWTQPPSLLAGTLDELYPSGATALYDALVASASLFGRRTNPRAALVVISDGVDTASDVTLRQATDAVRRFEPLVYAIAIDSATAMASRRVSPEALREITATSGGYTEVVRSSVDLGPATERIANELNKQYTLGYVPSRPPDDGWRGIRVRVRNSEYFTRARRGYYAVRNPRTQ